VTLFKSKKLLFALLLFVLSTLLGLIFSALSYASMVNEQRPASIYYAVGMNLTRFYLWACLAPPIFHFTSRFLVEFRPFKLRTLLLHIPILFLCSGLHQLLFMAVGWNLEPKLSQRFSSITEFYRTSFLAGLYVNILIALLISIAAHALFFYQNYRTAQIQQSQLKADLAQAQLHALKVQLHPHFLFNALHSISSLVLEEPIKANAMIARLGDFLRLTLDHSAEQVVILEQELEFVRCYLEIEQLRFEDRLTVVFEIEPETLFAYVPQLILQPVVENALRHAIAPRAEGGNIEIKAQRINGRLRVEVKDDGPGLVVDERPGENAGFGLQNVRMRLQQFYGAESFFALANMPEGGLCVALELPFKRRST
jgi:sensor histidine kinase YesM